MPDPNDKVTDPGAEVASSYDAGHSADNKKTCVDCGTSKTPLWRGGPAGPKSLCNACGIRSRKKRRVIVGITKGPEEMKKPKKGGGIGPGLKLKTNISKNKAKFGDSWKRRLLGLSREVSLQQSSSSSSSETDHRRQGVGAMKAKLGEVEQAAVLLMALSYRSVSA